MDNVILYTDGACSGNPGPGGWGAVLIFNGMLLSRDLKLLKDLVMLKYIVIVLMLLIALKKIGLVIG